MNTPAFVLFALIAAAVRFDTRSAGGDAASIERGRYLVENVAMCPRCHSGESFESQLPRPLSGGPVPIRPARPDANWAERAPRLAGTPPGTDEEIVRLLMTGIDRAGRRPRPPMPQFRMSRSDAESVVAYLRSLPPSP